MNFELSTPFFTQLTRNSELATRVTYLDVLKFFED